MSFCRMSKLSWQSGHAVAMQSTSAACAIDRILSLSSKTMLESAMEKLAPQHSVLCGQSTTVAPAVSRSWSISVGFSASSNCVTSGGRDSRQP